MKIAIVGFGLEGRSSLSYFSSQGEHELTICDKDVSLELPKGVGRVLGESYLDNLDSFDLIVRSSGLSPDKILEKNPDVADKITSQLNEFLSVCPSTKIIGVTGTKGKGTTSSLISNMLERAGKTVVLGGNIGIPMLSLLDKITPNTYVVLELSSFQLVDLREPSPHIAVCLMVVSEHLNWHPDLASYIEAKSELFSHQSPGDIAIYYAENELSKKIASVSPGDKLPYYAAPGAFVDDGRITIDGQYICNTSELKLLGKHNWQNACAAVSAVWQIAEDSNAICDALISFSGLPHRLEFVREIDGVKYYDDSFGTTPETATVAIEAFSRPKVLIAGGSDKRSDYTPMINAIFKNRVKHVVCIGDTGSKIAMMLEERNAKSHLTFTLLTAESSPTMTTIVDEARKYAAKGDVVLLSTGCASFDMFKNYKDRGEQFKSAVQSISTSA